LSSGGEADGRGQLFHHETFLPGEGVGKRGLDEAKDEDAKRKNDLGVKGESTGRTSVTGGMGNGRVVR